MASKKKQTRSDGFANVLTKVGDRYRDKTRAGITFARDIVDEITAEEIWLGDDIAARVIEMPPKVQLQNGFSVNISELEPKDTTTKPYVERGDLLEEADEEPEDDAEEATETDGEEQEERAEEKDAEERMKAILDDLETVSTFIEARQWSRAYGGSAILLGIDDGAKDLAKPVNEKAIKAIRFMVVLRPREIWPTKWSNNPRSALYGKPIEYSVQRETNGTLATSPFQVHHSRIIRFDGIKVSRRHTRSNRGWGDSILNRLFEPLADFQQSYKAVPNLIADFAQGVHKVKGLAELLLNNEDEAVTKRIESMDLARSVLRSLVIDSEDDFTRQSTPIAGLAELLDRCAKRFAASADMPVSMLMGDQPAGMNATGEQNTRWWYDAQAADRELKVRPAINRLVRLIFLSSEGPTKGKEPERWTVEFANLWIPSEAEVAELRSKVANADKAYVDAGVLTPEEVAISRFGGDKWSIETRIDTSMRRLQADQTKTAVANKEGPNSPAAAAKLSSLKGPGQPGGGPEKKPAKDE
jgi:phage-related protein (TIGR01555 family)